MMNALRGCKISIASYLQTPRGCKLPTCPLLDHCDTALHSLCPQSRRWRQVWLSFESGGVSRHPGDPRYPEAPSVCEKTVLLFPIHDDASRTKLLLGLASTAAARALITEEDPGGLNARES